MTEKANHPIKSLEKTVAIVESLKRLRSATLQTLAADVELHNSTVHNHLSTLREHEYVVKEGDTYRLSLKFLNVGGVLRNDEPLYEAAKPNVDQLAADTGELATLATHERGLAVVFHRAKGESAVDIDTHVGSQVTLHNSALGKAILAHLPDERIEAIIDHRGLPAITENTITDRAELSAELDQIEERGHAFDDEENWRGLRCIGAPILTEAGAVAGAISLSVPKNRIDSDEDREEYVSQIKNVANLIELRLTYS